MGVTGLWQLLGPVGRPVPLESLENKVLAIDISIWLNQALKGFRDSQGNAQPNAHLLGLFHRVCKLLFYKIKPVFVFDGTVPMLKKQTLAARQRARMAAADSVEQTAQQILANKLAKELVNDAKGVAGFSSPPKKRRARVGTPNAVEDMFHLPPLPESLSDEEVDELEDEFPPLDSASTTTSSAVSGFLEQEFQDLNDVDITSDDFKNLPPDIRYEIISEMKERRKRTFYEVNKMPTESQSFSQFQMNRLLQRSELQRKLEQIEKEMSSQEAGKFIDHLEGGEFGGTVVSESRKISSEDTTHAILVKLSGKVKSVNSSSKDVTVSSCPSHPIVPSAAAGFRDNYSSDSDLEYADPDSPDSRLQPPLSYITPKSKRGFQKDQPVINLSNLRGTTVVLQNDGKNDSEIIKTDSKNKGKNVEHMIEKDINYNKKSCDFISDKQIETVNLKDDETEFQLTNDAPFTDEQVKKALEFDSKQYTAVKSKPQAVSKSNLISDKIPLLNDSKSFEKVPPSPGNPTLKIDSNDQKKSDKEIENPLTESKNLSLSLITTNLSKIIEIVLDKKDSRQEDDLFPWEIFQSPVKKSPPIKSPIKIPVSPVKTPNKSPISSQPKTPIIVPNHSPNKSPYKTPLIPPVSPTTFNKPSISGNGGSFSARIDSLISPTKTKVTKAAQEFSGPELQNKLQELGETLDAETASLIQQKGKLERHMLTVSDQICQESQDLLKLFGVPFVVSPTEAEAQCAQLELLGLTQGTITDDSDIWLFGGSHVYKNFFTQGKYLEYFDSQDIQAQYGLDRSKLICLALLTGSDYTEGVDGVGYVRAMEILGEFKGDGLEILKTFKNWWESCRTSKKPPGNSLRAKFTKIGLPESFPNQHIFDAYINPSVDLSAEKFSWAIPDLCSLRELALSKFGWAQKKTDEMLLPLLKKINERQSQTRLDSFFRIQLKKDKNLFPSKRLKKAISNINPNNTDEDVIDSPSSSTTANSSPIKASANKRPSASSRARGGRGTAVKKGQTQTSSSKIASSSSASRRGQNSKGLNKAKRKGSIANQQVNLSEDDDSSSST